MTKLEEQVAEEMVAPVILKLLKPYSATQMTLAINNNINLANGLETDTQYLSQLRLLIVGIPYADDVAKNIKKKKWIVWFLNNALKHKRPDLYNQVIYNPNGIKYLCSQIHRLVKLIFT